ncbi:uncharacterized protein jing isoform X2 [Anabrus simplex]|uniref:uncharacterized protein jing isoform X2 n=1 Tax=Anabrus simplex TaxID=316456 RepID=UPI0035A285B8
MLAGGTLNIVRGVVPCVRTAGDGSGLCVQWLHTSQLICSLRVSFMSSGEPGVAVLSCTDCSASSSSGTSDITDPGSPFSTASTHSTNSESSDDMAPNVPSGRPDSCWPWGGEELDCDRGPPTPPPPFLATATPLANAFSPKSLKRQTAIVNHKTATARIPSSKRLKVEHKNNNNNNTSKGSTSPCVRQQPQRCCTQHIKSTSSQQGKITEYFKMQMKPASAAKKNVEIKSGGDGGFNFVSGTQAGDDVQTFLWNNKKNGLVTPARKPMVTPLKIPEVKRNGLTNVSSSQKLNLLFLTPPSSNLPESVSYKVARQDTSSEVSAKISCSKDSVTVTASAAASECKAAESVQQSEDFSKTLEVSVSTSSSSSQHSLPSPILSVPRTIRFPANHDTNRLDNADSVTCRWSECEAQFDSSMGLLEHLQEKHVRPQVTCENYVCLWVSCKVYARTSCSRSWLERHVLSHGGNKPFCCIVDGCGQRFSSQTTLERHVNGHFNQSESSTNGAGARRSIESVTSKLFRRNGKKLRYRRQPWSARMFDYFDSGIMEGLQHRLINMTAKRTHGDIASAPGNTVTVYSKVMARRVETDGKTSVLLRWFPEDILSDEWLPESEVCSSRNVAISQLPVESIDPLHQVLFGTSTSLRIRRPRKPGKPA